MSRSKRMADQLKSAPEVDRIENTTLWSVRRRTPGGGRSSGSSTTVTGPVVVGSASRRPRLTSWWPRSRRSPHPRGDHLHDDTPAAESYYDKDLETPPPIGDGVRRAVRTPARATSSPAKADSAPLSSCDSTTTPLVGPQSRHLVHRHPHLRFPGAVDGLQLLGIIPEVFGGKSLPLDHGHEQRTFTKAQKPSAGEP